MCLLLKSGIFKDILEFCGFLLSFFCVGFYCFLFCKSGEYNGNYERFKKEFFCIYKFFVFVNLE